MSDAIRLDLRIAALADVGSRSRARSAIESGKVLVDGEVCTAPGMLVLPSAQVELQWRRAGTGKARRQGDQGMVDAGLAVLFEDAHVIAVNKPPGLLSDTASVEQHRTRDSVWKRLRAYLRPTGERPFTVHRIDRDTSGVVLFARTEQAEHALREQFRARDPERVYWALVSGLPPSDAFEWRDHTRWHAGRRLLGIVPPEATGARETISHVRVIARFPEAAEIEVRLETGRRNQIRLQAATRGLPLLGERLYAKNGASAPRQLLHARRLTVRHPDTNQPLTVEAPCPQDYLAVRKRLA
jgi:23S rRNA pseudouridine1911/1915/1917 synthase